MRRCVYLAALVVMLALVFLGTVSAAPTDDDTTPVPPACPPHGKQAVLHTGTRPDGAYIYYRFCGPARFTVNVGANTIRLRGFCDPRATVPTNEPTTALRWLQAGLIKNGPLTPAVRGIGLVLSGANPPRAGVVQIIDNIFQIPGVDNAFGGTAVAEKGWQRGHFWVTARPVTITGSWDCRPNR